MAVNSASSAVRWLSETVPVAASVASVTARLSRLVTWASAPSATCNEPMPSLALRADCCRAVTLACSPSAIARPAASSAPELIREPEANRNSVCCKFWLVISRSFRATSDGMLLRMLSAMVVLLLPWVFRFRPRRRDPLPRPVLAPGTARCWRLTPERLTPEKASASGVENFSHRPRPRCAPATTPAAARRPPRAAARDGGIVPAQPARALRRGRGRRLEPIQPDQRLNQAIVDLGQFGPQRDGLAQPLQSDRRAPGPHVGQTELAQQLGPPERLLECAPVATPRLLEVAPVVAGIPFGFIQQRHAVAQPPCLRIRLQRAPVLAQPGPGQTQEQPAHGQAGIEPTGLLEQPGRLGVVVIVIELHQAQLEIRLRIVRPLEDLLPPQPAIQLRLLRRRLRISHQSEMVNDEAGTSELPAQLDNPPSDGFMHAADEIHLRPAPEQPYVLVRDIARIGIGFGQTMVVRNGRGIPETVCECEHIVEDRHQIAIAARDLNQNGDFFPARGIQPFVGVELQHPVGRHRLEHPIPRPCEIILPGHLQNAGAELPCPLGCTVT